MSIIILSDIHGQYSKYEYVTSCVGHSVQLGDFGFDYSCFNNIDANRHKFIKGNHDLWNCQYNPRNYLGRFGVYTLNGIKFFYISGGYSIDDIARRLEKIKGGPESWFWQEEMRFEQMLECYELFLKEKPEILLTHSPPRSIINEVCGTGLVKKMGLSSDFQCQTSSFIQSLVDKCPPKLVIAGHLHKSYRIQKDNTLYMGLAELETFLLTQNFINSL